MSLSDWHLAVKLADQPLAPKSILRLPETELGEYSLGGYSISFLKQLIAGKLQESVPDPELIDLIYCGRKLKDDQTLDFYGIQPGSTVHVLRKSWPEPDQKPEPVDKVAALREFRVLHTALHSSSSYREAVFKMLSNKESLDQIIVATPGLSSDPIALGVLQDKDLFSVFADPNMLDTLVPAHPALVNAIVLVLHSVAGSTPLPGADSSSRSTPSSSYRDMPGESQEVVSCLRGSLMMKTTFTQEPGPCPLAAHPTPAQRPWGTVELLDPGPSPRASWPLPWLWPALQRAALTHRLLAPRAIPRGPHHCPLVSSQGLPSPMTSSAKPCSMPCRPLGSPAFRASGSPSCSSCVTWAFRTMN
uniref:Ubiquitin like 7 n=1 Tax=Myotis myotis TaxID=51298 RepID=A0A7J8ASH1_MYOMY|nr:ubiquitin like 7 [Myotis myotis]